MMKMFTRGFLSITILLLSLFTSLDGSSQCANSMNWDISPSPVNGTYEPGQVLTVCFTLGTYQQASASWLHGFIFDFPSGFDISSVENVTAPASCSGSGGGNWAYYPNGTTSIGGSGQTFGAGFFYDSNSGGPLDGNPGNNYGDPCTILGAGFTFCFDITLSVDCGGGGNPFDGIDLTMAVQITGDGESGSWGGTFSPCTQSATLDPDINVTTMNCCDAESGISPGVVSICENGVFDLFTILIEPEDESITTGGFWTGPTGYTDPSGVLGLGTFDPTSDPAGEYSYNVFGADNCISSTTIIMEFNTLGLVQSITDCSGLPSTLQSKLTAISLPLGGDWYAPGYPGVELVMPGGQAGNIDPTIDSPGIYTYVYYDSGNCLSTLQLQVTFATGGAAGTPGAADVCTSDPGCYQPFFDLGGNPTQGGNWVVYDSTETIFFNYYVAWDICMDFSIYHPTANGAPYYGDFVFTYILGAPPCEPALVQVLVDIYEPVNTGEITITSICITDPPLFLESLLDGTPDLGLTWSDAISGAGIPNLFDPAAHNAGDVFSYLYTGGLAGTTCESNTTLDLTILPAFAYAGENHTITVCQSDDPITMLDSIPGNGTDDPQTGGTFLDPALNNYGNFFTPAVNAPGTYVFTYNITSTCASDQSTLTIILEPTLDPGTDGILDICDNAAGVALSDGLTGSFDTGGIWTNSTNITVDAIVDGNSVIDGEVFTYTVGTDPCEESAMVTINLIDSPNAGVLTSTPQVYCDSDASFSLMNLFTTNPSIMPGNGAGWTDPFGISTTTINPSAGSAASGVYTYTIADYGCGEASVSISITIENTPSAGTDASFTACPNGTGTTDLFSVLGGTPAPGGTWTNPFNTPVTGIFNPATPDPAGIYTYTVGTNCTDQATVTVTYTTLPNPGTSNSITVCAGDPAFNLINEMGAGAVEGTWSNNTIPNFGSTFNPATDDGGVYTNTVSAGTCPSVSATLTITVSPLPNAGANATTSFCETAGFVDLTSYLNGNPAISGIWTDASGSVVNNPINVTALCGNNYAYTYTVGSGTCLSSSTLAFDVICNPDAGGDGTIELCSNAAAFSLFDGLIAPYDANGTWSNTGGNIANPTAINPSTIGSGDTYTYTVAASPCVSSTAEVVVAVTPAMSASNVNTSCTAAQTDYILAFEIIGGQGSYTVLAGDPGTIVGNSYTSAPIAVGDGYAVTIADASSCANLVVSGISPNCNCPVNASFSTASQTICIGNTTTIGVNLSGDTDGNYSFVYSDGLNPDVTISGASNGDTFSVSPATTTTYTLISATNGSCLGSANGSVTIAVDPLNDAGIDINQTYCGNGSSLTLQPATSQPIGGTFTPASIILNSSNSGTYDYTMANGVCPPDVAAYNIEIDEPLSTSLIQSSCEPNQTEYTVSFTINGGTGAYTVINNGSGATLTLPLGTNTFTSNVISTAIGYDFTISDSGPCEAIDLIGSAPNCNCPVNASFSSGNETICIGSSIDLVLNLSGGTDGQYTVGYSPGGTTPSPIFGASNGDVITASPTTTTTYTLTSIEDANCQGSVGGSVTVTVEQLPNAGIDIGANYCGDGSNLILVPVLGEPTGGTFNPPSIILNEENSGVYSYTMAGNFCDDDIANYTINIDQELEITNLTAICAPNQLEYTVTFQIVGGTPPYSVNGETSTFNNTFSETLIFNDNPTYSYVISDNGPCTDVILNDITAPDCNCIAQGSISGSTSICNGDCTNIIFNGVGDAPYTITYTNSVTGASTTLSDINNGHIIAACPTANSTYTLTAMSDSYCEGVVSGSPVTVTVDSPVLVSNVIENCNNTGEAYQVQFNYTGGTAPYTFFPANTSTTPGTYLGPQITSGLGYNVTVNNAGACPSVVVSSPSHTCDCISDAGSITSSSLEVCFGETASVSTNGTETLDANDAIQYVLHNGSAGSIGTVLASSNDGVFTFNYGTMVSEAAYYINAVVGNNIGSGNVNLTDDCTSLSNGVQVVMHELPTATISGGGIVCPGESVDLLVTRTGFGAWDFEYAVNGFTQGNPTVPSGDQYTLSVTQPGVYTLESTSDGFCVGTVSGNVTMQNYETPTATLSGTPTVCEGSGDGPQIVFTGDGPWNFVYSLDGVNQQQINTNFPTYTIPVEVDGTYALYSLEGSNCTGTVSGSQTVEILESPTASITGGGTVCAGDSATFDVVLGGTGPWNVQYTVDGVPQNQLSGITSGYSFESSVDGDYVLVNVSDANCTGEVLTSQAALIVNPLPTADITSSKLTVCIGEEVQIGIDLEGVPPFNVTYVLNNDTTVATGLYSDFVQTLQPENPVSFEVLYVEDGSNPTCSSEPMEYTFIDAVILPNAPVLTSDTVCSYSGPVSIGVNAAQGLSYSWSPETNLSSPETANTMFQPSLGGPYAKVYEYVLTATNGECFASDTMTITVEPGPITEFTFSPDPISSEDPTVFFKNKTIGRDEVFYFWEFDSLDTSSDFEPSYKFPDGINDKYTVKLTAIDPITGCISDYSEVLNIRPEMLIYVPNAFTPDSDGKNDLWGPVLTNVDGDNYKLSVYSRTGQLVFTTTDVTKKWNGGMLNDGYYVQPGVYVWMIETKNNLSLEEVTMKGIVTVVR